MVSEAEKCIIKLLPKKSMLQSDQDKRGSTLVIVLIGVAMVAVGASFLFLIKGRTQTTNQIAFAPNMQGSGAVSTKNNIKNGC